jgi:hypothetical protein
VVIEPFAGSAGYSLFYGCCRMSSLFDVDPFVCGVWDYPASTDHAPGNPCSSLSMPEVGDSVDNYALPQEAEVPNRLLA